MFPEICAPVAVTLDYKALLLLLNEKGDEDFILGGKGYRVEFCAFLRCNWGNHSLKYFILYFVSIIHLDVQ